jgi:hypothetical protein
MKAIVRLLIVIIFLIAPIRFVSATSEKAYQDYLFQYDQYRLKLNNFKVARTEYLKYKTLLSETTALDTVKGMMIQRNLLLRSYLLLLTEKLNENQGLTAMDRQLYQALIQNENSFLVNHTQLIGSIGSVSDATDISKQLESHYLILYAGIRQTLTSLSLGELMKLNTQYKNNFEALRKLVDTNKPLVTPEKQSTTDRWLLQINNKQNLYQQKVEQIMTSNSQLKGNTQLEMDERFVTIQKNLNEAKQYLSEGTAFMQELLTLMRYKD